MNKVHGADIDIVMALAWCADNNVMIQFTNNSVRLTLQTHTVFSDNFLQAVYEMERYVEFVNRQVVQ